MSFRQTPPDITKAMEEAGQVWVWIHDEPLEFEWTLDITPSFYRPGHWEIRGTGARFEDSNPGR